MVVFIGCLMGVFTTFGLFGAFLVVMNLNWLYGKYDDLSAAFSPSPGVIHAL